MATKSLNKVMLIGNITRDPELRYTPAGNAVATFGLATNRSWKTESGEIREEAEFHRLVAWNKLAELCSQLCTKGRKIYVEGRLQTRSFTGSDNAQHTVTEIVIDDMLLLDSKFAQAGGAAASSYGPNQTQSGTAVSDAGQKESEKPAEETGLEEPANEVKKTAKSGKKAKNEEKEEASDGVSSEGKEPTSAKAKAGEDVNIDDIPF